GLEVGAHYERIESILLPAGFTGRYRIVVRTDADGQVFENGLEANNTAFAPDATDIMPVPYADLVGESIALPAPPFRGETLEVTWTVANRGIGLTTVGNWVDTVALATDPEGKKRIGGTYTGFEHFGHLAVGETYERTAGIRVPDGLSGPVYVVVT